jgi:uracil-DNA glycosylase
MTDRIELPEWNLVNHANKVISNFNNNDVQMATLWSLYRTIWQKCSACNDIHTTRKVMGEGDPNADVMIIGEGPGENEELQLRPFIGAAGKILNNAMRATFVTRQDLYISNSVLCRCT